MMNPKLVTKERFQERIQELSELQKGWLNGDGESIPREFLEWFSSGYKEYLETVPLYPYLFPTILGGLSLEYDTKNNVSVEIDPLTRKAEFIVNLEKKDSGKEFITIKLDLSRKEDWERLNFLLTRELSVRK